MCEKHSFVMDREGRCYNASGVTESHALICRIWGIDQDEVNAYEWQPPEGWPNADWTDGFKKDQINFEEKASHVAALERYILATFPTRDACEHYRNPELHGRRFADQGHKIVIACQSGRFTVTEGVCWAYDQATVEACGQATVEAYDQVTVRACDNAMVRACDQAMVEACGQATVRACDQATVEACDHVTVEACDQVTVRAYGQATVIKPLWYHNNAKVKLGGLAVLIDRTVYGKVSIERAARGEVQP